MTNIPSLIAAIRDSQPREHTPLCYTPDVCQCGANVYNALRNHALALCEAVESSKKLYELALSNQMNWIKKWDAERLAKEAAEKERDDWKGAGMMIAVSCAAAGVKSSDISEAVDEIIAERDALRAGINAAIQSM